MVSPDPGAGDRRFAIRWGALALGLLALPYVALAFLGPPGSTYSGVIYHPNDAFFYFAQMLHGHLGDWTFRNVFTYRDAPPLPIHWLYPLVGRLTPGVPDPIATALAWHALRLGLAAAAAWQAWLLFGEALPGRAPRRVAFLFLLFTSGLAVYQLLAQALVPGLGVGAAPYDLAYTESSTFFELLYAPHFAAVVLLVIVCLRAVLAVARGGGGRWMAAGGAAALVLSTIHPDKPLTLVPAAAAFVLLLVARRRIGWRRAALTVAVVLPSLPYPAFLFMLTRSDPQFLSVLGQDNYVPPGVLGYVLGYGLPGLFAVLGVPRLVRRRGAVGDGELLLWCLAGAGLLLTLFPLSAVPRKSVEGVQLALAGLAGRNLVRLELPRLWRSRIFAAVSRRRPLGYSRRRLRLLSINLALILSSPSILAVSLAAPRAALADSAELYLTAEDRDAVTWLRDNAGVRDVVVGSEETGQFVAAYGGQHVVFGHFDWTPDVGFEHAQLAILFGRDHGNGCVADSRSDPAGYLHRRNVAWLYYGPRESRCAMVPTAIHPGSADYLRLAFHSGETAIYRVTA
ncbi:MAG: hypothetical protein QOE92_193 [Chloroflexota bacterium]|jgi:hypothetical protein|nr:hypothetical protein [Chloroflexota bacterium]